MLFEPAYKAANDIDAVSFLVHAAGVGLARIDDQLRLQSKVTKRPVHLNSLGQNDIRVAGVGENQSRGRDVLNMSQR